ncbi:MAG: hypothetical protein PHW53_04375 [Patescibacteria group bacterium]|nr:hypothetical protein [Patescibacteria group bacterium]
MKTHHIVLILGMGGLAFFILYSYLNFFAPLRFNSPDETANYFFINLFSEQSRIWTFEPTNFLLDGIVHPRSIQVINDFLVPGGFLGMIFIYGIAAKLITPALTVYLTPLFAVIASWAFFAMVKKYLGERYGLLAWLLLLVHPAWWYYTSRGLLPNVLFLSLLIISVYFIIILPFAERRRRAGLDAGGLIIGNLDWISAGLFLGLALFVRPAEAPWIWLAGAALIVMNYKKIKWVRVAAFAAAAFLIFSPTLILNNYLYGGALRTGYNAAAIQASVSAVDAAVRETTSEGVAFTALKSMILPFGFEPRNILNNFVDYMLLFTWAYSAFCLAGIALAVVRGFRRKLYRGFWQYIIIFGLVTTCLIAVYGSWEFSDNINPFKTTIGNSYLRYWLPSFVLGIPLAVWFMRETIGRIKSRVIKTTAFVAIVIAFVVLGASTAMWGEDEGLVYVRKNLWRYEAVAERVMQITPDDALIVTDRSDKIFFPERKIVYPFRGRDSYEIFSKMYFAVPLYYYGVAFSEDELADINARVLLPLKLRLRELEYFDNEALYIFDYLFSDETNS